MGRYRGTPEQSGDSVPDIDWLLRDATEERAFRMSQHTVVDDPAWRASIERLDVCDSMTIWLTDTKAHRDVTVEAHADPLVRRRVSSQVTLAGRADMEFRNGRRTEVSTNRALMFRMGDQSATFVLSAGMRYSSVGYELDAERMSHLFDDNVPSALRSLLDPPGTTTRFVVVRADRRMRGLARNLGATDLHGPLRILMLEGVVLQLLALQAAAAGYRAPAEPQGRLSGADRDAVHAARDLLLGDMRRPPGLGQLAAAVGLSEKRLNAGFREAFGRTVFEVLRDERLEQARIVLLAEEVPLKEVSFRVGYNHANNFSRAFSRRFGVPPRQYLSNRSRRVSPD